MDLKKKRELLYYYIRSSTNFDPDEFKIDVDFNYFGEIIESYILIVYFDTYVEPDMDSISHVIKNRIDRLHEALTKIGFDENLKIVTKSTSKINFETYFSGPLIAKIDYNWQDGEILKFNLQYFVETIPNHEQDNS